MKILFISLMILSCSVIADDIIFKLQGKSIVHFSLNAVQSGNLIIGKSQITATPKKIYNIFRAEEKSYTGYNFFQLLNLVYGKDWIKNKKIIFNSKDGYHQISLIDKLISATENKVGILAYSDTKKSEFESFSKDGKIIDPGPLYLVWSNFTSSDKASHADTIKWPYQLVEINIE
jgi:hypothetical protein